jgi:uncharacterized protein (DUF1015 family)
VSLIKPFRAIRPTPEKAAQVACVPYDVIYESEARDLIRQNPYTFLRVTRPEAEDSDYESLENAKRNLQRFIDENILIQDEQPSYFIYRLAIGKQSQTGIVACCSLEEYESGDIKRHEKTRPDKVKDRTDHMVAVRAQTGLIFLTFRGTEQIKKLCADAVATEPLYDFACEAGVQHTVWQCAKTDEMTSAFAEVPTIYVADGHHRLESALQARNQLRAQTPNFDGSEGFNFVMAGLFPADELDILAYNRTVKDLNGLSDEQFFNAVGENFIVSETTTTEPEQNREICMYLAGKWYHLRFAVDYIREPDPIERLDVTILQKYILEPVLGIDDPRTSERIGFVGGGRGTEELVKMVDSGEARVAFSLYPTTIDDLFAVSDMNEIMPPKSTWFEPKLKDGLFIHKI